MALTETVQRLSYLPLPDMQNIEPCTFGLTRYFTLALTSWEEGPRLAGGNDRRSSVKARPATRNTQVQALTQ